MKNKICKTKLRKITKNILERYDLILENNSYGIICTELDKREDRIKHEEAKNITTSKREAMKIYRLLVKHRACVGTINDIIHDQMC